MGALFHAPCFPFCDPVIPVGSEQERGTQPGRLPSQRRWRTMHGETLQQRLVSQILKVLSVNKPRRICGGLKDTQIDNTLDQYELIGLLP
jgi:hypothetical protein